MMRRIKERHTAGGVREKKVDHQGIQGRRKQDPEREE